MTAVPTVRLLVDWDSDGGLLIGDFERTLEGWDADPANANRPTLARSTTRAYSGTASMLVTWSSSGTQPVSPDPMATFVSGRSYTMSAWVWVPTGSVAVKCAVSGISSGTASASNDQWTQVTYTFTATAATHVLQVIPSTTPVGGEQVWIDRVRLTGVGEDLTANLPGVMGDVDIQYGRDQARSLSPVAPGTLKFDVDNVSRDYSPENASSPLAGLLGPGREVLVEATYSGTAYSLYDGFLDDFEIDTSAGEWKASFSALDGLARLKNVPVSTAVYPAVRTGDAINILLDAVGWTADRDIDPGASTIRWWWLEVDDTFGALQEIVEAEGPSSLATIAPDGAFVFRDRHHRLIRDTSASVQATFRDTGPAGAMYHPLVATFSGSASSAWAKSDSGHTWTNTGGSASDYSESGGVGRHSLGSVGVNRISTGGNSVVNFDFTVSFATSAVALTQPMAVFPFGRFVDASNTYYASAELRPGGAIGLILGKVVAGVVSGVASVTTALTHTATTRYNIRFQGIGSALRARIWPDTTIQPSTWDVSGTDTSLTAPGILGLGSGLYAGNTNTLPVTVTWDNLTEQVFELDPPFKLDFGWRDVINSVDLSVADRSPAALPTEVWKDETSYTLAAGQSRQIVVKADNAFYNLLTPTQGLPADVVEDDPDFICVGGTVTVTFARTSGQSTTMTVQAGGSAVNVQKMRLRAQTITSATAVEIHREDPASISKTNGVKGYKPSTKWLNALDGEAIADLVLGQRADRTSVATFGLSNGTSDLLVQQLSRDLSDRVWVTDSESGFDAACHIEQISHRITDEGHTLETTLACSKIPTVPGNLFRFDVSGAGFDDGVFAQAGRDDPASIFRFDVAGRGFDQGRWAT